MALGAAAACRQPLSREGARERLRGHRDRPDLNGRAV